MDNIKVRVLRHPDLSIVALAARTCYNSHDKASPEADIKLLKTLWQKGHHSVFEHAYYTFLVDGCSRGCLHEVVRHRIASYSVQSTRRTLKRFLKMASGMSELSLNFIKPFFVIPPLEHEHTEHYINDLVDRIHVFIERAKHLPNDKLKYYVPESWRTTFVWTINMRSLANFLNVRLASQAHFEIRYLALKLVKLIDNPLIDEMIGD